MKKEKITNQALAHMVSFLKKNKGLNNTEIAKSLEIGAQHFSNLLNGGRSVSAGIISAIQKVYPYVKTITLTEPNKNYIESDVIDMQIFRAIEKKALNNEYNITEIKPFQVSETESPSYGAEKILLIYDLEQLTLFEKINQSNLPNPLGTASFTGAHQCDFGVKVRSNAMQGLIDNGGTIFVKEIKDLSFIDYGHSYLIVTPELTMPRIIRKSKNPDMVEIHHANKEHYDNYELPKSKIQQLFIIKKIHNDIA